MRSKLKDDCIYKYINIDIYALILGQQCANVGVGRWRPCFNARNQGF